MKKYIPFDLFTNQPKGEIGKTRYGQPVRFIDKRIKVFSLTMMCLLSVVFQAFAQVIVPSQIKSVTIFANQALVTREADVKVHKGVNEILIDIEAFHIDSDSVSATVIGRGELYSVQWKDIHLTDAPQKNIRA